MEGERLRELETLKRQAEQNCIPPTHIDELEQEQLDELERLEDDELLDLLELHEGYEKELENLLSDLSVS